MRSHIPGVDLFARLRRTRETLRILETHAPTYIRVMHSDLCDFRQELIKTIVGAAIAAAAGMMFIAFCSVAIIVTMWDSQSRSVIAWVVCGTWGVFAVMGVGLAVRALRGPVPFAKLTTVVLHDLATLRDQA